MVHEMNVSPFLTSRQKGWKELIPKSMAIPKDSIMIINIPIGYAKCLSFKVSIVLISLLSILLWVVGEQYIEITIAILSFMANGISQFLRRCFSASALKVFENDLIDMLDALGAAGVGTLMVLYLLG